MILASSSLFRAISIIVIVIITILASGSMCASVKGPRRRAVNIVEHDLSSKSSHFTHTLSDTSGGGGHLHHASVNHHLSNNNNNADDSRAASGKETLADFGYDWTSWMAYHKRKNVEGQFAKQDQQEQEQLQQQQQQVKRKPTFFDTLVDRYISGNLVFSHPHHAIPTANVPQASSSSFPSHRGGVVPGPTEDRYHHRGHRYTHQLMASRYQAYAQGASVGGPASGVCSHDEVLRVDFVHNPDTEDGKLYGSSWSAGYFTLDIPAAGAVVAFTYEVMWLTEDCNCGVEIEVGANWRLRDDAGLDERGFSPHSEKNANMSRAAFKRWVTRRWPLPASLHGQFVDKVTFSALGKVGGSKGTALFRNIMIVKRSSSSSNNPAGSNEGAAAAEEVVKVIWQAGKSAPLAIQNSFFKGSLVTSCQPPFLVKVDDSAAHGPVPLQRGTETRLAFSIDAAEISQETSSSSSSSSAAIRTKRTVSTRAKPNDGSSSDDHHFSAACSQNQQRSGDARRSLPCANDDARNVEQPSPLSPAGKSRNGDDENDASFIMPQLVSAFRDVAESRLSHVTQSMPLPYPRKWNSGAFNMLQHKLEKRTALLVLEWTARLKLSSPSSASSSSSFPGSVMRTPNTNNQNDKNDEDLQTIWDLLMLPALKQKQKQQHQSSLSPSSARRFESASQALGACAVAGEFFVPSPAASSSSSLTARRTQVGCALQMLINTRVDELQKFDDQRLNATLEFDLETENQQKTVLAERRDKKKKRKIESSSSSLSTPDGASAQQQEAQKEDSVNGGGGGGEGKEEENAAPTKEEQEEDAQRSAQRNAMRIELLDRLLVEKEDAQMHWDQNFIQLMHLLSVRRGVAAESGFPLFASVSLPLPESDEALPLLVHRLIQENGVKLFNSNKGRTGAKAANASSSETAVSFFSELQIKVKYLVLSLLVTTNKMATAGATSSLIDDEGFEDVTVREARAMTATFHADDF